jgi:hypothetical protein
MKEDEKDGAWNTHGEVRKAYKILDGKPEETRSLRRTSEDLRIMLKN